MTKKKKRVYRRQKKKRPKLLGLICVQTGLKVIKLFLAQSISAETEI